MAQPSLLAALRRGEIFVADGATGTNYQARGLLHGTPPEEWLFDAPDQVVHLHRDFIAAGADILLTNTFGATSIRLAHSALEGRAAEVNRTAVALAQQARGEAHVWLAASLGPTGQLLEPYGPLSRAEAVAAYTEQARAVAEAGVDLLVIETQFDLGEATAAIEGARAATALPLVCSFSYDMGAHTMMGLDPAQVARELTACGVDVVGINCGKSLEDNLAALRQVRAHTHLPVWMKPNAGLPRMDEGDVAVYDVTPEQMGAAAREWLAAGAQIVGGCCGTTPEHLREIARAAHSQNGR